MQIWFKDGQIVLDSIPEPKIEYIKKIGFPVIFHAVLHLQTLIYTVILCLIWLKSMFI